MKTLEFEYDVSLIDIEKMTIGTMDSILQCIRDELDLLECVCSFYVETFDEIEKEAIGADMCSYDYALELIQGYAHDRSRIALFASLDLITPSDRNRYLAITDESSALCKRYIRENAIWKG